MSTITKERVAQYANDPRMCNVNDEIRQIARIALASLEAEAYGYVHKAAYEETGSCGLSNDHEAYRDSSTHIAVYTAPPAPFALPVQHWEELCRQNPDMSIGDAIIRAAWWNHCAAMLQGADGNSPVIPERWENCKHLLPIGELIHRLEEQTGDKWIRVRDAISGDLISAMEEVLRISDRDHDAWHRARAAIAKCRQQ